MSTNLFQDLWGGWKGFWTEAVEIVKTRPDAPTPKPPNKGPLPPPPKTGPVAVKRPIKKPAKPAIKGELAAERAAGADPPVKFQGLEESWLESPEDRANRIRALQEKKAREDHRSKERRRLRWMNPGDLKIEEAKLWLGGGPRPAWTEGLTLGLEGGRLMHEGGPFWTTAEKQAAVKREYFDPKGFSTIGPIFHKLEARAANLTRRDVTKALRRIETYQLNFRRRHPPKVMARMNLTRPGIILADMFFPSKNDGWRGDLAGVVTVMDAYSRYVRAYAVERKTKKLVGEAISRFLREFASLGHMPLLFLSDKGSELKGAQEAMEPYRRKPGPLVRHSQTGKPVNLVEQTQAQIQRRMQVFRTSGITDDYSSILEPICDSINRQPRPGRQNKTPIELLQLTKEEREGVNRNSRFGVPTPDERFKHLKIGDSVRFLNLTFKEQVKDKVKGFAEKWSRDVFLVEKKAALAGNPGAFRYWLWGSPESFLRHELLKVPATTDTATLDLTSHKEDLIAEHWDD